MGAPTGNQFWKLRSKHGRDNLFASPQLLWEAATQYFEWVDAHPWWKNEPIKSGDNAGKTMKVHTARPYTKEGLCNYLDCSLSYFRQFKSDLREPGGDPKGFLTIIEKIEQIIYQQKFEGAAVGAFHANIIARDLGLIDRQENTLIGKGITVQLTDDE